MNLTDLLNLNLPDVWQNILTNLDRNDIENCRLVNKAFKNEISRQMDKRDFLEAIPDVEKYENEEFQTIAVRKQIEFGGAKKMSLHLNVKFNQEEKEHFSSRKFLTADQYLLVLAGNGELVTKDKIRVLKFDLRGKFIESMIIENIKSDLDIHVAGNFLIAQLKERFIYKVYNLHDFNLNGNTDGLYRKLENQMRDFEIDNFGENSEREEKFFHFDNACLAAIVRNKANKNIEFHYFDHTNFGFELKGSLSEEELFRDTGRTIEREDWISNWKLSSPRKMNDKLLCYFFKEDDVRENKRYLLAFISLPDVKITNVLYQGPLLHLIPLDDNHEEYDGMFFHCEGMGKTRFVSGKGELLYDFLPENIEELGDFINWDDIVPGPSFAVMFIDGFADKEYEPSSKRQKINDESLEEEETPNLRRQMRIIYMDFVKKITSVKKIVIEIDEEDEELILLGAIIYDDKLIFKLGEGEYDESHWTDDGRFALSCTLDDNSDVWEAEWCEAVEDFEHMRVTPKHGILAEDLNREGYRCILKNLTKGYLKQ